MDSTDNFLYEGLHTSDLDIPNDNELLAMEMQVEIENMRNDFIAELAEVKQQIAVMQKRFTVSMWILIVGVGDVLSWVYRSSKYYGFMDHRNRFVDVVLDTNVSWVFLDFGGNGVSGFSICTVG
ncbi:unnamed protein product [Lactuca saligna]|uniref:Uncharacterized protein n=1 Tax=Lactuca saligna TaxID=75948 RepID=A0AA35V9E8_LACSI|nr:unnamed protein product [Lactuca saligna]